jgi:hypothetical protein
MCRRSGRDEVTSKRSEDVAAMKSQRVHGDQKKKILLGAYEDKHQVIGKSVQRLEVKTRRRDRQKNPRPEQNQAKSTHLQGRSKR